MSEDYDYKFCGSIHHIKYNFLNYPIIISISYLYL